MGQAPQRVAKRLSLLSVHSQAKLNAVARELNDRPRKTLKYHSPAEKFAECVATIG
jgi:IS30 family transposase